MPVTFVTESDRGEAEALGAMTERELLREAYGYLKDFAKLQRAPGDYVPESMLRLEALIEDIKAELRGRRFP